MNKIKLFVAAALILTWLPGCEIEDGCLVLPGDDPENCHADTDGRVDEPAEVDVDELCSELAKMKLPGFEDYTEGRIVTPLGYSGTEIPESTTVWVNEYPVKNMKWTWTGPGLSHYSWIWQNIPNTHMEPATVDASQLDQKGKPVGEDIYELEIDHKAQPHFNKEKWDAPENWWEQNIVWVVVETGALPEPPSAQFRYRETLGGTDDHVVMAPIVITLESGKAWALAASVPKFASGSWEIYGGPFRVRGRAYRFSSPKDNSVVGDPLAAHYTTVANPEDYFPYGALQGTGYGEWFFSATHGMCQFRKGNMDDLGSK